jgi:hypothetical protein
LELDGDEYNNDLTELNWETLGRWNAMVLATEGKILHMKFWDGVETVTVITPMPESGMRMVEYAVWYASPVGLFFRAIRPTRVLWFPRALKQRRPPKVRSARGGVSGRMP